MQCTSLASTTAMIWYHRHHHIYNRVEMLYRLTHLTAEPSDERDSASRHMILRGRLRACILPVNILWLCDSVASGSFCSGEIEGYCCEGSLGGVAAAVEAATPFAKLAGCWPSAHCDKLRRHTVPRRYTSLPNCLGCSMHTREAPVWPLHPSVVYTMARRMDSFALACFPPKPAMFQQLSPSLGRVSRNRTRRERRS